MSVVVLSLAGVALLLVASALWLWQTSVSRGRRDAATAFVERQLGSSAAAAIAKMQAGVPQRARHVGGIAGWWDNLLLRAGVSAGSGFYTRLVLTVVVPPLLVLLIGGWLGAVIALLMVVALIAFRLWLRASKRNEAMVRQLPGFIDSLVRLITIGNSLGSAFHTAVPAVDSPLLEVLDRANQLTRAGMELDVSLFQVARLYRFYELELMAAVIGVALRFGGRSDMVLERMAGFMRDLQQAREELHALSAEVRLSAWILTLLPLMVGGFIVIFNNQLFMGMWNDGTGRKMLLGALMLQVIGSYWLYRMAKSV